jgi:hypothetical protein
MRVIDYLKSNGLDYLLPSSTEGTLPNNLCNQYLKTGIDHVLVGMRRFEYIDDFKKYF